MELRKRSTCLKPASHGNVVACTLRKKKNTKRKLRNTILSFKSLFVVPSFFVKVFALLCFLNYIYPPIVYVYYDRNKLGRYQRI